MRLATLDMLKDSSLDSFEEELELEVWQYGLWSFLVGVAKLGRFLPKGAFANYVCI